MDPNTALADLREAVQKSLGAVYRAPTPDRDTLLSLLTDVAESFDNLDEFLSKGGFLPGDWVSDTVKGSENG